MLKGRKVKVMAKLPHIHARIMQQLDKAQSCTLPLIQHSPTDFIDNDKEIQLEDKNQYCSSSSSGSDDFDIYEDDDNKDEKDEIDLNNGRAETRVRGNFVETKTTENCNRTEDLQESTDPGDSLAVEVIVANFAESTTDQEILALLADFQADLIKAKVSQVSAEEPFTYAVVRFKRRQGALDAVTALNGSSGHLGSTDLVVEVNE